MNRKPESAGVVGLVSVGVLMLAIGVFSDPIGSSPDTGVIELSSTTLKWLLSGFGVFFLLAGLANLIKQLRNK